MTRFWNLLALSFIALFLLSATGQPALATDKDAKKAKASKPAKKEERSKKKATRRAAPTDKRLSDYNRRIADVEKRVESARRGAKAAAESYKAAYARNRKELADLKTRYQGSEAATKKTIDGLRREQDSLEKVRGLSLIHI